MVNTIHGPMDEEFLEKRTGFVEGNEARTEWVEYWTEGEMVHRSVAIFLKPLHTSLTQGSM
jgi:hypothetical protein